MNTDSLDAIDALLAEQRGHDAWTALRPFLRYSAELVRSPLGPRLLSLFAATGRALGENPAQEALDRAARSPDDVQALYDAAFALYEQRVHDPAAAILARAVDLAPIEALVTELSANLEALALHEAAAAELLRSGLCESAPMVGYLYGFNLLLGGKIEDASRALAAVDRSGGGEHVEFACAQLDAMLDRARAIAAVSPMNDHDLTGWHAALNASVLLHESPAGYEDAMRGRYAWLSDNYELMREAIDSVGALFRGLDVSISRVIAAPDRSSRILARATATVLGVPLVAWAEGASLDGLVVVADLDQVGDVEVLRALREHRPEQRLWAHASQWVNPFPYAPDVTTILVQQRVDPWSGGAMRVDPETQEVRVAEADSEPDAVHAQRIVDAVGARTSHRDAADVLAIAKATRAMPMHARIGLFRSEGNRVIQRMGGPVKSARFD